ncbi:MAG: NAD(P)H-dependent oxidoreductase [Algoriphagus aquaeductus]|uniref:glutathione-regulated potassium-efflux system oxidoreductase KefF n=1 Tax=Algoriphagus aquaeductus TaxID=475299 RepID=UPI00391AB409
MRKILVLFAHPKYEQSDVNHALLEPISHLENIEIRDLYELYPDFNIDIQKEQELLFQHEIIIWHHPIYWYSCPPLLKQWIDLVLEYGWAYGPGGVFLKNKYVMNVVTSGGSKDIYSPEGRNRYTIEEFLRPFEATAYLCLMRYLPPFHVGGTHRISPEELEGKAQVYRDLILTLRDAERIDFPYIQKT